MWEAPGTETETGGWTVLPRWSVVLILRPRLHRRCWSWLRSAGASDWAPALDWNCPWAEWAERPAARHRAHHPTQGHIWKTRAVRNRKDLQQTLPGDRERDLHTGALSAAAVTGAHLRTAVTDVQVIQSPRLLLIEWCRLKPAEACGCGPVRLPQKTMKNVSILKSHYNTGCWMLNAVEFWLAEGYSNVCNYF